MSEQYEYRVSTHGGYVVYSCNDAKELRNTLSALAFRQPELTAHVCRRVKEEGVYGKAWHVCHADLRIKVPAWHVGPYADSIYMVGNGTVVVGLDRAVAVVVEQGLFTEDEALRYVLAISTRSTVI